MLLDNYLPYATTNQETKTITLTVSNTDLRFWLPKLLADYQAKVVAEPDKALTYFQVESTLDYDNDLLITQYQVTGYRRLVPGDVPPEPPAS